MMVRKIQLRLKWMWNDVLKSIGKKFDSKKFSGEVRVLCLHGVCENSETFINGRFLKEHQLETLLGTLKHHFNVISLDQFLEHQVDSNRLNILITFDDGYENNKTLGLPILERYELPATIFCTAKTVLWTDLIDIVRKENISIDPIINVFSELEGKSLEQVKTWAIKQNKETLNGLTDLFLELLQPYLNRYKNFYRLIDDAALKELGSHSLISLANHGGNHLSYTHQTRGEYLADLEEGVGRLKRINASHSEVFAYPYGHYSENIRLVIEKSGFPEQFIADGAGAKVKGFHDRLVVNPFISLRNQLIAIRDGKY